MPKSDGSVTIDVRAESKELKKDLKDSEKVTESSASSMEKDLEKVFSEASKASGKAVSELKSDIAELASDYQKQGLSIAESYQKAFTDIISESAGAQADLIQDAGKISEAFGKSASESRQEFERFFSDIDSETGKVKSVYEKLNGTISQQQSDLNTLKEKYRDVVLEQGKSSDGAKELAREIQSLSGELKENKTRLNDAESAADKFDKSLDDVGDSSREAEGGFSVLGGAVSSFVGNVMADAVSRLGDFVQSVFELSEATEEYRSLMNKVSGSAESFGYSIDDAKERYKDFYRYLGDDQMATNAITNLMGMKVNTETLDSVINGAIATWTAYGDSIPIESLTESITETVNVSKVTGTFADAINWAKLSHEQWNSVLGEGSSAQRAFNEALSDGQTVEDAFSAALAATSDQQDRANLVAGLLNETYGESKATYDELSGSILDANDAEAELKETQAELGETLTPLNTKMTQLKNKALKAMAPMIEDVADAFGEMIDGIDWDDASDMIGNVMEVAIDGLEWLSKHIRPVTTLVVSLGAAWLTYKGIMAGANAVTMVCEAVMTAKSIATGAATVAMGAHTTATVAATAAQQALNIAQMACPFALLAAGAVALAAGIYTLVQRQKEAIEQEYGLTEAQKAHIETVNEMRDSYEEMDTARQKSMDSVTAEYGHLQALKDELVALVDANGQIKEGEEDRANFIINQLSQALGIEEQDIRDIIAANGDLSASLDTVIQKKKAEAMLSANEEAYKEAIQNQTEALNVYSQAVKDAEEAEKRYKDALEENSEVMASYNEIKEHSVEAAENYAMWHKREFDAVNTAKQAYEEASGAVRDAESTYVGYCSTIENYEGASAAILSGDADAIESTMERLQNGFISAQQGTQITLKQQVTDYKDMVANLQTALQEGMPGVTQEMVTQAQNLVTQAEAELSKFEQQAPWIADAGVRGFNSSIAAGAPDAASAASNVAESAESSLRRSPFSLIGNTQVGDYTSSIRKGSGSAGAAAGEVADEAEEELDTADTNSVGRNFIQGFLNGTLAVSIIKPIRNLAQKALGAMKDALGIHSPSKEAFILGDYFVQGFTNAIEEGEKTAAGRAKNLANAVLESMQSAEKEMNRLLESDSPKLDPVSRDAIIRFRSSRDFHGMDTSGIVAAMQDRALHLSDRFSPVIEYEGAADDDDGEDVPVIINNRFEVDGEPLVTKTVSAAIRKIGNDQRNRGRYKGVHV